MRSRLHSSLFLQSQGMVPPSEACWYGHINWSLAQAQQQSSMGLSQSFPSKWGGKARSWPGFPFNVQKRPVPGSTGACLAKRPHVESRTESHLGGKESAGGGVSASSADTRRKGGYGGLHPRCVTVLSLFIIFICSFSVGMLSHFSIIGETLLVTGLC